MTRLLCALLPLLCGWDEGSCGPIPTAMGIAVMLILAMGLWAFLPRRPRPMARRLTPPPLPFADGVLRKKGPRP